MSEFTTLHTVETLTIYGSGLASLNGFASLREVTGPLRLFEFDETLDLTGLNGVERARDVRISRFEGFYSFDALSGLIEASLITFDSSSDLVRISGFDSLTSVDVVRVTWLPLLYEIEAFANVQSMSELELVRVPRLVLAEGFLGLTQIDELELDDVGLTSLNSFSNLADVGSITVTNSGFLKEFGSFAPQTCNNMILRDNEGLDSLLGPQTLTELDRLEIEDCGALVKLDGLETVEEIDELILVRNSGLTSIDSMSSLQVVGNFTATFNRGLGDDYLLDFVDDLTSVNHVTITGNGP
ncbi:MAG: hypothetical protein AAGA48_11545 [Myxococcota bacterium]